MAGALRECEETVRLRPDDPAAHHALAVALETTGNSERARQEYHRYLELAPNAPDASQVRARLSRLRASK